MDGRSFISRHGGLCRRTVLAAAVGTAMFAGIPGIVQEIAAAPSSLPPLVGNAVLIGDFSVVPLFDGPHSYPFSVFAGTDEETMRQVAGMQAVPSAFNAFLLKHGKDRYLVDTGNGTLRPERTGQLPLCLQQAKTVPADINKILITHLHADHAGGLVKDGRPVFPKAKVYVARAEYDYWTDDEAMRKAPEERRGLFPLIRTVLHILEQSQLVILFTPGEMVAPGITSVDLAGHTPGHTGFMLISQGKKLFFIGDLLHGAALQMPRPDITVKFDTDPLRAKELRLRTFKQLATTQTLIAGSHLPFPGIGIVQPEGTGYKLVESQ